MSESCTTLQRGDLRTLSRFQTGQQQGIGAAASRKLPQECVRSVAGGHPAKTSSKRLNVNMFAGWKETPTPHKSEFMRIAHAGQISGEADCHHLPSI